STVAALFFGLAPALATTRTDLAPALKEESGATAGGYGKRRLRNALVVAQVALSLILLICAALSLRSLQNARRIDPGFEPRGLVTAQTDPALLGYTPVQGAEFYREFRARVQSLPGVESAAYASHLPLSFSVRIDSVAGDNGRAAPEREWPSADSASVGPGYFAAMRIPIARGREFAESDTKDRPQVVVVNETLAARLWPGQDPIGQRLYLDKEQPPSQVVGIARDAKYRTLGEAPRPFVYRNLLQNYESGQVLLARVTGDVRPSLAAIRQRARQLNEKLPVTGLQTADESISVSLLLPRAGAAVFGTFGLLGLALASVGLYGVMAYMVSQRTHEIGIRMALGARRGDILKLVIAQGMTLTLLGVALGVAGAVGITRLIAVIPYGVGATDAATFTGVSLLLGLIALVACVVPARRATRVDPLVALRYE
ncbi:MAG TPA: FtsX-like permease family protein, partial [Terriglobia bacterium]